MRPKRGEKRNTQLAVTFDRELSDKIREWGQSMEFESPEMAARSLIAQALASAPVDGMLAQARISAFNSTRMWLFRQLLPYLNELAETIRRESGAAPFEGETED